MRAGLGALVAVAMLSLAPAAIGAQETFTYNGFPHQSWTAPDGVTEATFDVYGGEGGYSWFVTSAGGLGGRTTATIPVTPGRKYLVIVGSRAHVGEQAVDFTVYGGQGSEVRSGLDIEDRMIAAGGGGGSVAGDGAPGGIPGSRLDNINGGLAHPFNNPPNGAGGASWGPPGTKYEQGVREGDGLVTITYDAFPQDTFIDSGPDGLTRDETPTFTFSSDEADSNFACFDEFVFGMCSGPGASHTTERLADGPHTVAVTAIDPAGNIDPTPAIRTFIVDATAPKVTITEAPRSKIKTTRKKAKVKVSFGSEAGAKFKCRLDRSKFKPCDTPYRTRADSKGGKGRTHTISIEATDRAGNVSKPATVEFRISRK
jgi:Bacterial Ig-like domain